MYLYLSSETCIIILNHIKAKLFKAIETTNTMGIMDVAYMRNKKRAICVASWALLATWSINTEF